MNRKNLNRVIVLLSLCLYLPNNTFSQFYETGEPPFSQKYNQIKTEHFKLVFPTEITTDAQKMANMLEASIPHVSKSLNREPKPIPVLLNNTSVESNGFVVWAPKRMELIMTPSRGVYSQDWMRQLVLHESRHVVQVDKMNQGITKTLGIGFGQMVVGGVTGMLPFWFLEGDAVSTETALSNSGRGRDPSFQNGWRSILLEKENRFSYEKAYFGSYKDYVPDYYELGYQLTSYARKEHGENIWDNVLNNVGRRPYQLYPFYFGLKKYANSSKVGLYNNTMDYLKKEWGQIDSEIKENEYTVVNNTNKKVYTSYNYPIAMDNSFFIVEKSSLDGIQKYIIVDGNGNEKVLHTPGYRADNTLSYASGKLVWDEIVFDPLWPKKSYNVIKVFDITTGLEHPLTSRTRYFHPDITPDGNKIVCTEVDVLNQNYLVFLDAATGNRLKQINTPENKFPQHPRWDKNGKKIVLTLLGENGKSIEIFDCETGQWEQMLEPTFTIISKPRFIKNSILFNGAFSGTDNIYSLNPETKKIHQVTNSRFGAYDAFILPNGNQFVYSDYTSGGYNLLLAGYNPGAWIPLEKTGQKEVKLYETLSKQEGWKLGHQNVPDKEFEAKRYSRLAHLINIHSWAPFYFEYDELDFQNPEIYPGAQLFFQNLLSTSIGSVGYSYHDNDHYFNIKYDYKGTRPALQYSMEYGGNVNIITPLDSMPDINTSNISNNVRLYLPIDLTNNKYSERFTPSVEAKFRNYNYFDFEDAKYIEGLTFVEYSMLYYRLLKHAHRDIRSKFGQVLQLNYVTTPADNDNFGTTLRAYGTLYFPGIAKNHSLRLQGNYQEQNYGVYLLSGFTFPRGIRSRSLVKSTGISIDYAFPLFYPDLNIGRLAYFKRFRLNGFYDYSRFKFLVRRNNNIEEALQNVLSYGVDIITDMYFAHFVFPISTGVRLGYETSTNSPFAEFLFGIDIGRF